MLLTPKSEYTTSLKVIETPNQLACSSAYNALVRHKELPKFQQKAFTKEWDKLSPSISIIHQNFIAPLTGYFTCIEANFMDVLSLHNSLLIPASVFGSSNENLSICTCLFNISYTE